MDNNFYFTESRSEFGPIPLEQLRELAKQGRINPNTLLRRSTEIKSFVAQELPGLFDGVQTSKGLISRPLLIFALTFLGWTIGRVISDVSSWLSILGGSIGFGLGNFLFLDNNVTRLGQRTDATFSKAEQDDLIEAFSNSKGAAALRVRGRQRIKKNDYKNAIDDLTEAIKLDPNNSDAIILRAHARGEKMDYTGAIEDLTAAISINPTDALFGERGRLRMLNKDYFNAKEDLAAAICLNSNNADILDRLAWLLATCPDGDYRNGSEAANYARQACELTGFKNASMVEAHAAAQAESGNFEAAVNIQKKALELFDFNNEKAKSRLQLYMDRKPYHQEGDKTAPYGQISSAQKARS